MPADRADLEALMHPAIMARAAAALGRRPAAAYQILVIPLWSSTTSEAASTGYCWWTASEELQLRRVQVRDGVTLAQARAVLAAQASRAARLAVADDVIVNDGDLERLRGQVEALHIRYGTLARETLRQAQ